MPIETTTVYTKERLMRFQDYIFSARKIQFIFSAAISVICLLCAVLMIVLWGDFKLFLECLLLFVFISIYNFAMYLLPRLLIRKAKNMNAEVHFSFGETAVRTSTTSAIGSEETSLYYTAFHKIGKKRNELYLFLDARRAMIVDLAPLSEEQIQSIKNLLEPHFKPRKFKWK